MTQQPDGIVGSRAAIDTLAWLIHDAFEGDPDQSLLANLRDLSEKDWTALPVGGGRSEGEGDGTGGEPHQRDGV